MLRYLKSTFLLIAVVIVSASSPAAGGEDAEIAYLLAYLKGSGCTFFRNGSWHDADEAAVHLSNKYRYLVKKGLVDTAEQFIDRAATQSSVSGKPYLVKCGDSEPVPSAQWFHTELNRYHENR